MEADSLSRSAEGVFRAVHGDRHYSVAFSLITRAEAALRRGLGAEAESLASAAVAILEPLFGPGFPTAAATCRLGGALMLQGRSSEASALIADALGALEGAPGVPEREIRACRTGRGGPPRS